MTVAAGMGVSLGIGVAVGCNCANAVPKACVRAAFISGVDAGTGWHVARRIGRRNKKEVSRDRFDLFMMCSETREGVSADDTPSHLYVLLITHYFRP